MSVKGVFGWRGEEETKAALPFCLVALRKFLFDFVINNRRLVNQNYIVRLCFQRLYMTTTGVAYYRIIYKGFIYFKNLLCDAEDDEDPLKVLESGDLANISKENPDYISRAVNVGVSPDPCIAILRRGGDENIFLDIIKDDYESRVKSEDGEDISPKYMYILSVDDCGTTITLGNICPTTQHVYGEDEALLENQNVIINSQIIYRDPQSDEDCSYWSTFDVPDYGCIVSAEGSFFVLFGSKGAFVMLRSEIKLMIDFMKQFPSTLSKKLISDYVKGSCSTPSKRLLSGDIKCDAAAITGSSGYGYIAITWTRESKRGIHLFSFDSKKFPFEFHFLKIVDGELVSLYSNWLVTTKAFMDIHQERMYFPEYITYPFNSEKSNSILEYDEKKNELRVFRKHQIGDMISSREETLGSKFYLKVGNDSGPKYDVFQVMQDRILRICSSQGSIANVEESSCIVGGTGTYFDMIPDCTIGERRLLVMEDKFDEVFNLLKSMKQPVHLEIVADSGSGKTSLAKYFVRAAFLPEEGVNRESVWLMYPHGIIWLDVGQYATKDEKLREFTKKLALGIRVTGNPKLQKEKSDYLKEIADNKGFNSKYILERLKEFLEGYKCLVVFDNVWDFKIMDALESAFGPPGTRKSHILITTRRQQRPDSETVKFEGITEKGAEKLLRCVVEDYVPNYHFVTSDIANYVTGFSENPFTVLQYAHLLGKLLQKDVVEEKKLLTAIGENETGGSSSALEMSYRFIHNLKPSGEELVEVIKMFSVFCNEEVVDGGVPKSILEVILKGKDCEVELLQDLFFHVRNGFIKFHDLQKDFIESLPDRFHVVWGEQVPVANPYHKKLIKCFKFSVESKEWWRIENEYFFNNLIRHLSEGVTKELLHLEATKELLNLAGEMSHDARFLTNLYIRDNEKNLLMLFLQFYEKFRDNILDPEVRKDALSDIRHILDSIYVERSVESLIYSISSFYRNIPSPKAHVKEKEARMERWLVKVCEYSLKTGKCKRLLVPQKRDYALFKKGHVRVRNWAEPSHKFKIYQDMIIVTMGNIAFGDLKIKIFDFGLKEKDSRDGLFAVCSDDGTKLALLESANKENSSFKYLKKRKSGKKFQFITVFGRKTDLLPGSQHSIFRKKALRLAIDKGEDVKAKGFTKMKKVRYVSNDGRVVAFYDHLPPEKCHILIFQKEGPPFSYKIGSSNDGCIGCAVDPLSRFVILFSEFKLWFLPILPDKDNVNMLRIIPLNDGAKTRLSEIRNLSDKYVLSLEHSQLDSHIRKTIIQLDSENLDDFILTLGFVNESRTMLFRVTTHSDPLRFNVTEIEILNDDMKNSEPIALYNNFIITKFGCCPIDDTGTVVEFPLSIVGFPVKKKKKLALWYINTPRYLSYDWNTHFLSTRGDLPKAQKIWKAQECENYVALRLMGTCILRIMPKLPELGEFKSYHEFVCPGVDYINWVTVCNQYLAVTGTFLEKNVIILFDLFEMKYLSYRNPTFKILSVELPILTNGNAADVLRNSKNSCFTTSFDVYGQNLFMFVSGHDFVYRLRLSRLRGEFSVKTFEKERLVVPTLTGPVVTGKRKVASTKAVPKMGSSQEEDLWESFECPKCISNIRYPIRNFITFERQTLVFRSLNMPDKVIKRVAYRTRANETANSVVISSPPKHVATLDLNVIVVSEDGFSYYADIDKPSFVKEIGKGATSAAFSSSKKFEPIFISHTILYLYSNLEKFIRIPLPSAVSHGLHFGKKFILLNQEKPFVVDIFDKESIAQLYSCFNLNIDHHKANSRSRLSISEFKPYDCSVQPDTTSVTPKSETKYPALLKKQQSGELMQQNEDTPEPVEMEKFVVRNWALYQESRGIK